jgi:hypothetical protein
MADGILNLGGALVLVGSMLAAALLILWISIRPLPPSARADWQQSLRDEEEALDLQSSKIVP